MAINNIDSQFASARAEVRALIKYCNPNTNIGGQSIEVLQSIVDTLDAVQKDSFDRSEGFDRFPQYREDSEDGHLGDPPLVANIDMRQTDRLCFEGSPMLTKPDFNLSAGLDKKACKL